MSTAKTDNSKKRALKVVRAYLIESDNISAVETLNVNSFIEDDLGIDSIGRAEILRLLEKEFSLIISEQLLIEAETVHDIIHAIRAAEPITSPTQKHSSHLKSSTAISKTANTLLQALEHHVSLDEGKAHIYLQEENKEYKITYGNLYQQAKRVAQGLIALGVSKGDTIALMLPTSEDFFYAFLGTLYAGAIPVPIYPPFRAKEIERYVKNESKILASAEVRILITFEKGKGVSRIIKSFIPTLKKITTVENLMASQEKLPNILIKTDDPALIQYTSGSTGNPKGVLLQHRHLLTNLQTIANKLNINKDDVIVSWLPLYHDMGLIGAWLGSLYYGIPLVLHSPLAFLTRPEKWLWSIHRYKGTISASPNFGYEFCNNRIDEKDIEGLDLSSWRLALNGAEAIYADTIRNFIKKFAPYHFNPKAMYPVYGLAESTVALSFPEISHGAHIEKIDREIFVRERRSEIFKKNNDDFLEFVSCGKPLPQHEIRIVDDQENLLKERHVGRVQFRGPSSMQGYYHNPRAVKAAYHNGWWDTGDMGYIANNEFFPTGRKKDLIIKAGRNLYPQDIERVVNEVPLIRKGSVVAFGIKEKKRGTEKIIVVAEIQEKKIKNRSTLTTQILRNVKKAIGIPPDKIVLVPPKTLLKTSSGKPRRSAAKIAYLKRELKPIETPIWRQLTKLLFKGITQTMSRWVSLALQFLYTLYIGFLLIILLIPSWLLLFILPKKISIILVKKISRIIIFLSACSLKVKGEKNIEKGKQYIYVANHTSFVDTFVLFAILPTDALFLAKKELTTVPFLKSFIKKLGHLTITRGDFKKSEDEMKEINRALKEKKSLIIYPEGTFTYARGVQHFKLGAFTIAVENDLSICPISLKGIRDILRSTEILMCPGKIEVRIGTPINPKKETESQAIHIRDQARAIISRACGEERL